MEINEEKKQGLLIHISLQTHKYTIFRRAPIMPKQLFWWDTVCVGSAVKSQYAHRKYISTFKII